MLDTLRKTKGLNLRELYFYHDLPDNTIGEDVQYFIQCTKSFPHSEPFFTSIIDLHLDENSIVNALNKTTRYDIRRAKDKDCVTVTIINKPSHQDIEKFALFYDLFAKWKNLASSNKQKLEELAKNSALVLAFASVERKEGTLLLGAQALVCDGQRARGLWVARNVPSLSNDESILGARANKYMEWQLIMYFKENGCHEYDLGGISKLPELQGINKYKEAFGGLEVLEFNLIKGISTKGKIAVFIFRGMNKFKKWKYSAFKTIRYDN